MYAITNKGSVSVGERVIATRANERGEGKLATDLDRHRWGILILSPRAAKDAAMPLSSYLVEFRLLLRYILS